jgi:hypothetical protein
MDRGTQLGWKSAKGKHRPFDSFGRENAPNSAQDDRPVESWKLRAESWELRAEN